MLTSNRSDFRPYTRNASVTISNRRVRTRMHGGVAGVGGQPPPLCRSNGVKGLSNVAAADSESVEELIEEGQAFEAEVVSGVENAPDPDEAEVTTEGVPEDDVPPKQGGEQ